MREILNPNKNILLFTIIYYVNRKNNCCRFYNMPIFVQNVEGVIIIQTQKNVTYEYRQSFNVKSMY